MDRRISLALGALVVILVGALVWRGGLSGAPKDAGTRDAGAAAAVASVDAQASPFDDTLLLAALAREAGAPRDEAPSIALPSGTPKAVRFGVILVQYRGAEGAPAAARSKDDAQAMARTLAESAKTDFKGTV